MHKFILLLFIPPLAFGEIYENQLKDGTRLFSDMPSPNAKVMVVPQEKMNVLPMFAPSNILTSEATKKSAYTQLEIHAKNDETSFQTQDPIELDVTLTPALESEHRLQLLLDNQSYGASQSSTHFILPELARGTHQVKVQILDTNNQVILTSKALTLYKHQASEILKD